MCVLRATGSDFDVDTFVAASPLDVCAVHRKGDLRLRSQPNGPRREASGFNANVSAKEWSDLPGQVQDALQFLAENERELRRLRAFPGVDGLELDLPIEQRMGVTTVTQSDRLPANLLLAAGQLGIDIVVSIYPVSEEARASGGDDTDGTV
jgi:hypothetical protein